MADKGVGYYLQKFDSLVSQQLNNLDRSQFDAKAKVEYDSWEDVVTLKEKRKKSRAVEFNIVAQESGYVGPADMGGQPSVHVYDSRFLDWAEQFKYAVEQMAKDEGVPVTVRVVQEFV